MLVPTVEKYRESGKNKGSNRERQRLEKLDALPGREKMRIGSNHRTYCGNCRQIRRWLANQVGRPWNAIHADLCAMTPPGSLERIHLMDQANYAVETNVVEQNGVLYSRDGFRPYPLHPGSLYVRNGVLLRMPYAPKVKLTPKLAVTFTGQMNGVGICGGQWFEVTFTEYTPNIGPWGNDRGRHDVFLKEQIGPAGAIEAYGKAVVATGKRAMSKAEIRRFRRDH